LKSRALSVLFVILFAIVACGGCAKKLDLRLQYQPGELVSYHHKQESDISTVAMGIPMAGTQEIAVWVDQKVLSVDESGNRKVEQKLKRIEMSMDIGPVSFGFDTEDLDGPGGMFAETLLGMTEVPLLLTVDSAGTIVSIEGMVQMRQAVRSGPTYQQLVDKGQAAVVEAMFDEGFVSSFAETAVVPLPPQAVEVGETWTIKRGMSLPKAGKVEMTETLTLESVENGIAKIRGNPVLKNFDGADGFQFDLPGAVGNTVKMSTFDMDTVYLFDMKKGSLINTSSNMNLVVEMTGPAVGTIAIEMKTRQTTELVR
jgi:Family of unknown function (DUF6263)